MPRFQHYVSVVVTVYVIRVRTAVPYSAVAVSVYRVRIMDT